jgi:rhamnogalacturonan endolyase
MNNLKKIFIVLSMVTPSCFAASHVVLQKKGMNVSLNNGLVEFNFNKNGSADSIIIDNRNILSTLSGAVKDPDKHRSGYLDYYSSGVKGFSPDQVEIIKNTPEYVHVAYIEHTDKKIQLEYHLIMMKGVQGLYQYVVASNLTDHMIKISELRNIWRFDPQKLNYLYNGVHSGKPQLYAELEKLPKVQDETWRLPSGEIYSKYDYAGYVRQTKFWGVYGQGLGAWIIPGSHEYYSGDELKQDLLVHQDAIILNYMTGSHFGTPDLNAYPGWQKVYGPWLIYINKGSKYKVIANADKVQQSIVTQWPFNWVDDARYITQRTNISGYMIAKEKVSISLSSSINEQNDMQTLGYLYQTETNNKGFFTFRNVKPGIYRMHVYANEGSQPGLLLDKLVSVHGKDLNLGYLEAPFPDNVVWSIGTSDRTAKEFNLANKERNYNWFQKVPENLDYIIGKNTAHNWYYAQTKPGKWNVHFKLNPNSNIKYYLNLAFAAVSKSGIEKTNNPDIRILINGKEIQKISYANDKSIYREAMQSGQYHFNKIEIPASILTKGNNTITMDLKGGCFMYDMLSVTSR